MKLSEMFSVLLAIHIKVKMRMLFRRFWRQIKVGLFWLQVLRKMIQKESRSSKTLVL